MTDSYGYNAYGVMLTKEGDTDNSYHYCGEQMDVATGLYYLRARYMNPLTATFMQKDSYEGTIYSPVTQNGYLYTGGNPVMYVDPSGNSFSLAESLTSIGISEVLSDVIVTSTYYMILAGELGAALTITREAYYGGAFEKVKNKLISIYDEEPYIPIFVADNVVQEIMTQGLNSIKWDYTNKITNH